MFQMKYVWALLLYLPATVFAQTALDNWYGDWTGYYSGGDSGTCSITISSSTITQAALSGSCISDAYPQFQNLVSGQVGLDGAMTLAAGTSSAGGQFTGTLQGTSGSGQWVNSVYGTSGTWIMSKLSAQTTKIIASGLWNVAIYTPICNYTELSTTNTTYANGVYSTTWYSSNSLGANCQNMGPRSCTGNFSSAQDMVTTSQFQAAFNAMASSCGIGASIQSISFPSPDSISGTGISFDGVSFSVQWSRASSAPTFYILAVANTGSGTVTSSPSGISCGTTCSGSFTPGTTLSLTATPSPGSYFSGWSGDCTGAGSCVVTMNAVKSVTATFKPVPFIATISSVITAISATITTSITFNAPDMGKPGSVFVTAWVPVNGLSTLGISTALSSVLSVTSTKDNPYLARAAKSMQLTQAPLAATDPNSFVLVQLTSSGWQLVVNGQLIPFASGVMGDQLAAQTILNNANPNALIGSQFCLGYGTSAAEMINAGRMMPVATIPGSSLTVTSSGSCNVTEIVAEFYNTNLDHYFITSWPGAAEYMAAGLAGPGWIKTDYSFKYGGTTPVCRFYGSMSPGPNSHFYTVNQDDCAALKQLQAVTPDTEKRWNFEGLDFTSTPPDTDGLCPTGTVPVYRAYNDGWARGVDSNHRITSSLTAIREVVARGWISEGVVMCAPN